MRRSRDRLMTALREAGRRGELTIAGVSSAAGVTRATFYNHFVSLEEAAWFAMSDSWEQLLAEDAAARREGADPGEVGRESLRRIVELLRADGGLARLADNYPEYEVLPGLADIVASQVSRFRAEFGAPSAVDPAAEDIFIAAGLYAVLATGARGEQPASTVASVAYALLPEWMRHPGAI